MAVAYADADAGDYCSRSLLLRRCRSTAVSLECITSLRMQEMQFFESREASRPAICAEAGSSAYSPMHRDTPDV